jgi:hypothetical protein
VNNNDESDPLSWIAKQMIFSDTLCILEGIFNAHGIKYLPIKGAYLLQSGLALKIKKRKMVDIDILVKREDFTKAAEALLNRAQTVEAKNVWPFERSFFIAVHEFRVCVEIHYQLNYPERFLLDTYDLFKRATLKSNAAYQLDPHDALCVLICHALVHIPFSLAESIPDEIELISRVDGFKWEVFWERMLKTGADGFAVFIMLVYDKKTEKKTFIPNRNWYPRMLAQCYINGFYKKLPEFFKRLFFELPFLKDPSGVMVKRLIR